MSCSVEMQGHDDSCVYPSEILLKAQSHTRTRFRTHTRSIVGRFVRIRCTFGRDLFVDFFRSWSGFTYGSVEALTRWECPNVCLSIISVDSSWSPGRVER